jgi:hypothetical protein
MTLVSPPTTADDPAPAGPAAPSDPELLIREARRRHRRRLALTGVVLAALVVAGALGYGAARTGPPTTPESSGPAPVAHHPQAVVVNAAALSGTWHVHTFEVTIGAHGRGVFNWPIHVWCGTGPGSGPPPCDALVPGAAVINGVTTNVEQIVDGGHATLRLTSVSGTNAHGTISGSTDPSEVPDGPATFAAAGNDTLTITPKAPLGPSALKGPLCGPRAAALSVSQQQAENINCGA